VIPNLDSQIGITVYSTEFDGIGGKIRVESEDFQVTEIISQKAQNSINSQEGYAVYKLKKKKIDTNHSLSESFSRISVFSLESYGEVKDKISSTAFFEISL